MTKEDEKRIYGKVKAARFKVEKVEEDRANIAAVIWATVFAMAVAGVIVLGMNVIAGAYSG